MELGVRVVRGPDWQWGIQDGGEGFVGTVVKIGRPGSTVSPEKTVVVIWDNGGETNYRVGYEGAYDLRLLDNAPAGVKHQNIYCDGCHKKIAGLRFKCTRCYDYDLCLHCYMSDKHDLSHVFQRFDTHNSVGVELPPRQGSTKILLRGIFVGAKVQRGVNWEWGDQDGGPGKTGRVLDIRGWDNESWRSVANVVWSSGFTNIYSIGHKGRVDLCCVEPAAGGHYYRAHLPLLGEKIEVVDTNQRVAQMTFVVGDRVKVAVDAELLKRLQEGHGGWNPKMTQIIGEIGVVHRFTEKGDIRIYFQSHECRWTLNPCALTKEKRPLAVGDKVCISSDRRKVEISQIGHGEWIPAMVGILGKIGKIVKVYKDGDLRVTVEGQTWTLNPICVDSAPECLNTNTPSPRHHGDSVSSLLSSLMENKLELDSGPTIEKIVREAAKGNAPVVLEFMASHPHLINGKLNNKTCLQVTSHQGHVRLVSSLLSLGADFNLPDDEGDTALHYAAFGDQAEVIKILLEAGANPNNVNNSLCSPLHVAVSKQHISCVKALLEVNPDVNLQDSYGDTVLHDAIGNEANEAIELLCSTPAVDLTLRNKRGFNPLHHAALKGNVFATDKLISRARQMVDVKKEDGFAALHLAALNGHRSVVESLITDGKANIDLTNNRKQTPLMLAVSQGHTAVIELLVSIGAKLSLTDEDGDTALHMALLKKSTINSQIQDAEAPTIYGIWEEIKDTEGLEGSVAVAIACYLVQEGCPMSKNNKDKSPKDMVEGTVIGSILDQYVDNISKEDKKDSRRVECGLCAELNDGNALLEPCGHKVACEDCSSRLKKCFKCSSIITKRIAHDGRAISFRPRQAECLRYLETKIAEIEETHTCSICMERRRNVAFLCGHGACDKCAAPLRSCHMCRKTITKKINLY